MISEIERFHSAVRDSPDLRAGLDAACQPDNAFIAYARSKGYSFSKDELRQWGKSKEGELPAADLDKVVGGRGYVQEAMQEAWYRFWFA